MQVKDEVVMQEISPDFCKEAGFGKDKLAVKKDGIGEVQV
jgi:hypothetical protein